MTIRSLARRLALSAPPMRRFYDFAITASARADEAERLNQQLMAELAEATREREAFDLQTYTLRSDIQRVTERNDQLNGRIHELTSEKDEIARDRDALNEQIYALRSDIQRATGRNDQLLARVQELSVLLETARQAQAVQQVTPHDLKLLHARLAAQIAVLTQDVNGQIKKLLPDAGPRGDGSLYLDLLEKVLTGEIVNDPSNDPWNKGYDPQVRLIGWDWPKTALTMIGTARMRNLRMLTEQVIEDGVPGDFLEAGVWRGGACIFMRGVLAAYGVTDRRVWVADSFAGLPPADPEKYPADSGDQHSSFTELAVSVEEVSASFARFGLLDDQVRFLKGWFADTLPTAPVERLAILRLDGDMYSSTIQTLDAMYAKVQPGGYIIVDDYILEGCRKAVTDFRRDHGIEDAIHDIDGAGVYWRKGGGASIPNG